LLRAAMNAVMPDPTAAADEDAAINTDWARGSFSPSEPSAASAATDAPYGVPKHQSWNVRAHTNQARLSKLGS
jgi:hypothetical protein